MRLSRRITFLVIVVLAAAFSVTFASSGLAADSIEEGIAQDIASCRAKGGTWSEKPIKRPGGFTREGTCEWRECVPKLFQYRTLTIIYHSCATRVSIVIF